MMDHGENNCHTCGATLPKDTETLVLLRKAKNRMKKLFEDNALDILKDRIKLAHHMARREEINKQAEERERKGIDRWVEAITHLFKEEKE